MKPGCAAADVAHVPPKMRKKGPRFPAGLSKVSNLGFLDQPGLDRLDRNEHALRAAVRQLHANALKIRAKLALRDAGHVSPDAAALFGLTLAVDDRAFDRTPTGDCTNSGHGDFELVKGSE